jgi:ATP-binding cassette subfamily B protein
MAHFHGGGFTGSTREEDALGKAYDARLMKRLLRYAWPFKSYLLASLFLMLMVAACRLAIPFVISWTVGNIFEASEGVGDKEPFNALLSNIFLLGLGIVVAMFFFRRMQVIIINLLGQKIMHKLRTEVFDHLQSLSLSYFDANPAGRLVTRVTSDVRALSELFTSGIVQLVYDLFMIAGIVTILSLYSVKMMLISLIIVPPLFIGAHIFRLKARKVFRNIRMKIARVNAFVGETVSGIRIIQIFTQEERSAEKFEEVNDEYRNENIKQVMYSSVYFPFVEFMAGLAAAVVIWYGAIFRFSGELTLPVFLLFWQYVRMFFHPIQELSNLYPLMQTAMASSERIFKILDTKPDVMNPSAPVPLPGLKGRIDFRDVWFAYETDKKTGKDNFVLKDINFSVKPGESVALVGATGAGKTSIISILTRLYDVKRGSVLVDGVDIRSLDKHELRRHIGTVMQDVFLFSGNVRHNITLGEESLTDSQLNEACKLTNADRFISRLPSGLDSEVAERGVTFSGGERQLLSFARAVVREPAIIVLDEATSSVDTETERIIQQGLFHLMEGRTSIIVAHLNCTNSSTSRRRLEPGQALLSKPPIEHGSKRHEKNFNPVCINMRIHLHRLRRHG